MLFDSTAYILFLIFAVLLYWRLSFRKQNYMLLAASYFLRLVGLAFPLFDGRLDPRGLFRRAQNGLGFRRTNAPFPPLFLAHTEFFFPWSVQVF